MLGKSIELCLSSDIPFVDVFTGYYTKIRIHYIVMFTLTVMILLSKQNIKVDTFEELINNKNEDELGDMSGDMACTTESVFRFCSTVVR